MAERVHAFAAAGSGAANGTGAAATGDAPAAGEIAAADAPDRAGAAGSIDGTNHACATATRSAGTAGTAGTAGAGGGKADGRSPGAKQAAAGDGYGEVGWGGGKSGRPYVRTEARGELIRCSRAGYNRPGDRATSGRANGGRAPGAALARSDLIGAAAA